jgi:hypothetical protein
MPCSTSAGVNSGEKTFSPITSGLAEGTPLTISLKTLTWSGAAVVAATVARTIEAKSAQVFACRGVLGVNIMVYFFLIGFVSLLFWSRIHRMRETHTGQL